MFHNRKLQLFLLAVSGFISSNAFAGFGGATLGVSYPTPLGDTYSTLERKIGFQAEARMNAAWLNPALQFHLATFYEPYQVRGLNWLGVSTFGVLGGIQLQSTHYGSGVSPFIALDIGMVYDWMTFSGVGATTSNSSLSFANQVVPGIDVPITDKFGIQAEAPIRVIYLRTTTVILDAVLSLRLKL